MKIFLPVLGSKLDSDIHKNICRLAFDGRLLHGFTEKEYHATELSKLKIYKEKQKQGVVERMVNDYEIIAKNMFKKETNIHLFEGLKVRLSTGETGKIDGPFGQSGKFKISLNGKCNLWCIYVVNGVCTITDPLGEEVKCTLSKKKQPTTAQQQPVQVILDFKKYVFNKKLAQ